MSSFRRAHLGGNVPSDVFTSTPLQEVEPGAHRVHERDKGDIVQRTLTRRAFVSALGMLSVPLMAFAGQEKKKETNEKNKEEKKKEAEQKKDDAKDKAEDAADDRDKVVDGPGTDNSQDRRQDRRRDGN